MGGEKGVSGRQGWGFGPEKHGTVTGFVRWGWFCGPWRAAGRDEKWVEPIGRGKYEITEDREIVVEVFGR